LPVHLFDHVLHTLKFPKHCILVQLIAKTKQPTGLPNAFIIILAIHVCSQLPIWVGPMKNLHMQKFAMYILPFNLSMNKGMSSSQYFFLLFAFFSQGELMIS
jgi:hypothetical protein